MNIKKISILLSLLVTVLFSACEQDNMGPVYGEGGLTFSASSLGSVTIAPTDPTFTVDLFRGDTAGELSGALSVNVYQTATENGQTIQIPMPGATVTDYSFAAGENITTVTVDMSETGLAIGATATVELSFDATLASIGGSNTVDADVTMDYTWVNIGTGTFADNMFFYWYDNGKGSNEVDVDIFEAAEVPGLYYIDDPWAEYMSATWGADMEGLGKSTNPSDGIFQFQVQEDGEVVYNPYFFGLNASGMGLGDISMVGPTHIQPSTPGHNRLVDATTIFLAPWFVDLNAGSGWNLTAEDGVIIITLPTAE